MISRAERSSTQDTICRERGQAVEFGHTMGMRIRDIKLGRRLMDIHYLVC